MSTRVLEWIAISFEEPICRGGPGLLLENLAFDHLYTAKALLIAWGIEFTVLAWKQKGNMFSFRDSGISVLMANHMGKGWL